MRLTNAISEPISHCSCLSFYQMNCDFECHWIGVFLVASRATKLRHYLVSTELHYLTHKC